jgi:hypothetical protein
VNSNKQKLQDLIGGVYDEVSYLKDFINIPPEDTASSEDAERYKSINDQCQTIMMMLEVIVSVADEEGAKQDNE